ncbi:MAG: hypothetical protein PWP46_1593 [Fusobacteriaceae bacterium]|nr:hypothetical protein [Fusobacteriaceae bacterium]
MKKIILFLLFIILMGCNSKNSEISLNDSWDSIEKKLKAQQ